MLKLSIIIPVYNVEKYVEKCVKSCAAQNIPSDSYEIIVVNDGSPDNSLSIVENLSHNYSNIKIITQANKGLSGARNTGMKNAKGDYFMFVDSDDWIADNCLTDIISKLESEKPDALCICAANVVNGEYKRRQYYADETPTDGISLLKRGFEHNAWLAIWRADFFRENNFVFYEGIFHEDSELTPQLYYRAKKLSYLNKIVYYVRQNPNSITRSVNPKKSFDLVQVVCPSLSKFSKEVDEKYKPIFYDMIALHLNNAMHHIRFADNEKRKLLNKEIYNRKYLWNDIRKCRVLKYRIEAYMVFLLPRHPLAVYNLLMTFKK